MTSEHRRKSRKLVLPQQPDAISCYDDISESWLVSTYQLDKTKTSREGALILVRDMGIIRTLPMSGGVFRFERLPDGRIIAALTNGCLGVVDGEMSQVKDMQVVEDNILLNVSVRNGKALTADNKGSIHMVDLESGSVESCLAHKLPYTDEGCEVWSSCWVSERVFMSGGEDGLMKMWDWRVGHQPVSTSKEHSSGVVCLVNEQDTNLLTGSYDQYIRRFDIRAMKQPIVKKDLGGGVWAVEYTGNGEMLVSCMYNGWCVIDEKSFERIDSHHDLGTQLLYGASYCSASRTIASCTFNDSAINFDVFPADVANK